MKKVLLTFVFLVLCQSILTAELKSISIAPSHGDHMYSLNEKVQWTITGLDESGKPVTEGTAVAIIRNDFRDELDNQTIDFSQANPATVTLDEKFSQPGFISIQVMGKNVSASAGIAIEPTKIEPGQPCPDDFCQFWSDGKKALAEIPQDVKLEEIPQLTTDMHTIYRISLNTLHGKRAHGFLSVPKSEGKHPIIVNVPGAGMGTGPDTGHVDRGYLVLHMNVFGYPVPIPTDERKQAYEAHEAKIVSEGYPRYCYYRAEDRELYFFRDAYLGINSAIEYVAGRSDADPTHMYLHGTSQGGASALILGGLNGRFRAIVSNVPALCDHGGCLTGRNSGWPKVYDTLRRSKSPAADKMDQVEAAMPYLDAVNFARAVKCPIRVTVGFIDTTCSPSSVYAAFNVIPSEDKQIWHETRLGHSTGSKARDAFQWMLQQ